MLTPEFIERNIRFDLDVGTLSKSQDCGSQSVLRRDSLPSGNRDDARKDVPIQEEVSFCGMPI
jgi:hypothetical protein